MEQESGDDYVRRLASFIRTNEKGLAEAGMRRPRRPRSLQQAPSSSMANPFTWFSPSDSVPQSTSHNPKPVVLSTDIHHLFYILMRLEALDYDVGTLDVEIDNPSRPTSYVNFTEKDQSETLSLASFRSSLSVVSHLSLGMGWWSKSQPIDVNSELKYIYSSFTKLPALSVGGPSKKVIAETISDLPSRNALPMDVFKNLQSLECIDIDPRLLLGWDRLAESLRSLKIKKSGLEDVSDIFIGAVVDDQARRAGSSSRKRKRNIPRVSAFTFQSTQLPDSVPEVEDEEHATPQDPGSSSPPLPMQLSSLKWAFLRHLSLADNGLTFLPQDILPYLTSITHLDLSSNLFVSVPAGLGTLYNLISLNLSDNMIDSVLGIYTNLGQVLHLNLSSNRLESICGLERLQALERIDLRKNLIEESAEIGRLATLPNIAEVWIEGNPFCEIEDSYRVACFDHFCKERKSVTLDGTPPGYYERRHLTAAPPDQMTSTRPISTVSAAPIVAISSGHPRSPSANVTSTPQPNSPTSTNTSPQAAPVSAAGAAGKMPRRKVKRIVDLDGNATDNSLRGASHSRMHSFDSTRERKEKARERSAIERGTETETMNPNNDSVPTSRPEAKEINTGQTEMSVTKASPTLSSPSRRDVGTWSSRRPRHSRYQSELPPVTSPSESMTPVGLFETRSKRNRTRHSRFSASVYEGPATSHSDGEEDENGGELMSNAEAYRRRLEMLKKDMGEGWLKIYSQTQLASIS